MSVLLDGISVFSFSGCSAGVSAIDVKGNDLLIQEIQMKNFKGIALGLVLGIGLALSSVGFAQNTTQTVDQKKEAESCCAMASCCCKGDSCDMKMKHDAKNHAAKDGCCCCSGDSCDMKMKQDAQEKPKG